MKKNQKRSRNVKYDRPHLERELEKSQNYRQGIPLEHKKKLRKQHIRCQRNLKSDQHGIQLIVASATQQKLRIQNGVLWKDLLHTKIQSNDFFFMPKIKKKQECFLIEVHIISEKAWRMYCS